MIVETVTLGNSFLNFYRNSSKIGGVERTYTSPIRDIFIIGAYGNVYGDSIGGHYNDIEIYSVKVYNRALTDAEIQQNYEHEQTINRTTPTTYPLFREEKSYGIGLASQLSEEQLGTFRLSIDKTKFVAGLGYCNELAVVEYTYSETLAIMDTEEWSVKEEV